MPLPDIVVTKSDKKSVPIIKWKVKESSFVDENNNPIEINPGILFDMEKFYDNVDVHKLIHLARKYHYPLNRLTLK